MHKDKVKVASHSSSSVHDFSLYAIDHGKYSPWTPLLMLTLPQPPKETSIHHITFHFYRSAVLLSVPNITSVLLLHSTRPLGTDYCLT